MFAGIENSSVQRQVGTFPEPTRGSSGPYVTLMALLDHVGASSCALFLLLKCEVTRLDGIVAGDAGNSGASRKQFE